MRAHSTSGRPAARDDIGRGEDGPRRGARPSTRCCRLRRLWRRLTARLRAAGRGLSASARHWANPLPCPRGLRNPLPLAKLRRGPGGGLDPVLVTGRPPCAV